MASSDFYTNRRKSLLTTVTNNVTERNDKNRYQDIDYYVANDSSLYATLNFIALSISDAYSMYSKDYAGIQKKAQSIAFNLMKYGDVVISKESNVILPMFALTIIDNADRYGETSTDDQEFILLADEYIINEESNDDYTMRYKADDVVHLSLCSEGTTITDIMGRGTYGLYSISPVQPLLLLLKWKENLIETDIICRDKLIPREHHILNIEYNENDFIDIPPDEIEAAITEATSAAIESYKSTVAQLESGQPLITTDIVKVEVIESKVNYTAPNEMVDNISDTIISALNVPLSAVKGKSTSNYSAELVVSNYFILTVNSLLRIINEYFIDFYKVDPDTFDKAKVSLEIWKKELYSRIATIKSTEILTQNELRNLAGFDELKDGDNVDASNIDGRSTKETAVTETDKIRTPSGEESRNSNE